MALILVFLLILFLFQLMRELMKELHEQVRLHIEEKTTKYAKQANKGRKMVRFELGDLVWIHISKGRFPSKHKSKLMPRADGPFRIIEKVNDNAYKVDLLVITTYQLLLM